MASWLQVILIVVTLLGGVLYTLQPQQGFSPAPKELHVGVLPNEDPDVLRARYLPLLDFLSQAIQRPVKLLIPESYQALLQQFQAGAVDLAYFGGETFATAVSDFGAQPLVMRNTDLHFRSSFIVKADSTHHTLEEMNGLKCAFSSPLSTSGHVMPRQFLLSEFGLALETVCAEIVFAATHDQTAYTVKDGQADIGALSAPALQAMLGDGRLKAGDIRIIWQTPPYANYVWAVPKNFNVPLSIALRDAFLALSTNTSVDSKLMGALNANYFISATLSDFSVMLDAKALHASYY